MIAVANKKWGGLCICLKIAMYLEDNPHFITILFGRLRRLEFMPLSPSIPRISTAPATPRRENRQRGYRPYPGYKTDPYPYSSVWDNVYGELFDPGKIETISGNILKVKYYEELRLIIYTDTKKPVLVALGPNDYFTGRNKVLKAGDTVTVTGSMITVDDTPLMIATKIKERNEEMKLRYNEGHPIWMGWKNIVRQISTKSRDKILPACQTGTDTGFSSGSL